MSDPAASMTARIAGNAKFFAHRDAIHAALGSPEIRPSMLGAIECAFEGLEEERFDAGMKFAHTQPQIRWMQDAFLNAIVETYEAAEGAAPAPIDRERLAAAVECVRKRSEIPF